MKPEARVRDVDLRPARRFSALDLDESRAGLRVTCRDLRTRRLLWRRVL